MSAPKRPMRWGLIVPAAIFVLAVAGWLLYWNTLKSQAVARVEAFIASQNAEGAAFTANIDRVWGFPRELALELENIAYAPPDASWRMTTPHARVNVNPANANHIIVEFVEPLTFVFAAGHTTTLSADNLRLSIRTRGGALAQAGVEGDNIVYADPLPNGRGFRADRIVLNLRPTPGAEAEFQVPIDIANLRFERAPAGFEGLPLTLDALEARIAITHGAALLTLATDPLQRWREAGGLARIEGLRVAWAPAAFTASGELAFDDRRRPAGQLDLTFDDAPAALAALARSPTIANAATLAAGAETAPPEARATASEGVLTLNGLRLRTLDPIY